ncbi:MAG: S8 family serine peptidase, partial [Planctomycetota bacterium]|nr:S8 family serine peptidase [Planctomycetota bacterium]
SAFAGLIDPELREVLKQTPPDETVSTLVFMSAQTDLELINARMDAQRASLRQRHETVVRALQQTARDFQGDLLNHLDTLQARGRIDDYRAFWIANIIRVDAVPDEIRALADRADVDLIYVNYRIESMKPVSIRPDNAPLGGRSPEIGLEAIRAPEVWDMGITGEGTLVSTLDTGVDGSHPALASRWRGLDPRYDGHPEWAFFDPVTNWQFPDDSGTHGTHTMGTVCGGPPGDEIGVAPGADWIHAAVIDRVSLYQTCEDAILAFQWLIDPDNDPSTNWDVPAVCSNSWRIASYHNVPPYNEPCDPSFWPYLDACEAAGIVILFSAGNEGPSANTVGRPPDRATDEYRTCAVAAVDANDPDWPIAGFSSRGPTYCTPDGTEAIKPDIAAPGVNVRSSVPGGGYSQYSGTSMASPHVNGVVALMRQANPEIAVEQIKQIIYDTAVDLGSTGEDNSYGWGMIDAYEAVMQALSTVSLQFDFPDGLPEFINPYGGETIRVVVSGQSVDPEPGTGKLYYSDGGSFTEVDMEEVEENVYDAVFPDFDCGATVEYYFSAETSEGDIVYSPFTAPDSTYSALAYTGVAVYFEETMDSDPGWDTENLWAFGQPTGDGGEHGGPDPTGGYTGPNVYGFNLNGDYPNNMPEYHLTSTPIDCSDLSDVHLTFHRWLGVEQPTYDHAYIRVSTDGANWTTVWENQFEITDEQWVEFELDISEYVDGEPTVYLRWTMGTTDTGWQYFRDGHGVELRLAATAVADDQVMHALVGCLEHHIGS